MALQVKIWRKKSLFFSDFWIISGVSIFWVFQKKGIKMEIRSTLTPPSSLFSTFFLTLPLCRCFSLDFLRNRKLAGVISFEMGNPLLHFEYLTMICRLKTEVFENKCWTFGRIVNKLWTRNEQVMKKEWIIHEQVVNMMWSNNKSWTIVRTSHEQVMCN